MPRIPCLIDIKEILVGHYTLRKRPTGCTVITAREPFVAGVTCEAGRPAAADYPGLRRDVNEAGS